MLMAVIGQVPVEWIYAYRYIFVYIALVPVFTQSCLRPPAHNRQTSTKSGPRMASVCARLIMAAFAHISRL
ncbi:hypothetical protein EMIT048CA2_140171 [Pseudomonas chlororaphis]